MNQTSLFEINRDSTSLVSAELNNYSSATLTLYQVAKIINKIFSNFGVAEIRPQMMYNYSKNGLVVKGKRDSGPINKEEAAEFMIKFINKRLNK